LEESLRQVVIVAVAEGAVGAEAGSDVGAGGRRSGRAGGVLSHQ